MFLSEPTEEDCTVLVGWHIEDGDADGVDLDGLNVALAVSSPGHMAKVKWTAALYLDERADGEQSDALTGASQGWPEGHPERLASHIGTVLGISTCAMEFTMDDRRRSMRIGDIGSVEIEAMEGQQGENVTVTGHLLAIAPGLPGHDRALDAARLPRPRVRLGAVREERLLTRSSSRPKERRRVAGTLAELGNASPVRGGRGSRVGSWSPRLRSRRDRRGEPGADRLRCALTVSSDP